jgi:hypothetical protein
MVNEPGDSNFTVSIPRAGATAYQQYHASDDTVDTRSNSRRSDGGVMKPLLGRAVPTRIVREDGGNQEEMIEGILPPEYSPN